MILRWSTIAARLPGRTDNEIKNFWHTHLKKRGDKISNKVNTSYSSDSTLHDAQANSSGDASRDSSSVGEKRVISNYGLLPSSKDQPIVGHSAVSCDTPSGKNMGNDGSSHVSEEMEFWYNVFIKSGQGSHNEEMENLGD